MNMIEINCFTDGSCYYKSRLGGWAYLALLPNSYKIRNGGLKNTTSGRCEITALIKLLEDFKDTNYFLKVHIDSQYVVFLFLKNWLRDWIKSGSIEEKKNTDLLHMLWNLYTEYYQDRLSLIWVRGHTGKSTFEHDGNDIVDKFCHYKNDFELVEIDQI